MPKALATRSAIEAADNEQVIKLYELVSRDIRRRILNYVRGPNIAELVLDGLHLAQAASRIRTNLTAGGSGMESGEGTWESSLFHAPRVLTDKLSRSTLAKTYAGVDDGEWEGDDDA